MKRLNLSGIKFGRLTVERFVGFSNTKRKRTLWMCKCECGRMKSFRSGDLMSGNSKSCGCLRVDLASDLGSKIKHGMSYHPAYHVWRGIKVRCDNPNLKPYSQYGGRGIRYDPRWKSFDSFWEDMGETYKKGLSIDRIDNNGGYYKSNCKWSTNKEQQNNTRYCVIIKFKNKLI